jgi:hypothetical protein
MQDEWLLEPWIGSGTAVADMAVIERRLFHAFFALHGD